MKRRRFVLTDFDVRLLEALRDAPTVVEASRRLGVSRDLATYRLRRLAQGAGGPLVRSQRGGRHHGVSRLTPLGDRLREAGVRGITLPQTPPRSANRPNIMVGTYHAGPPAEVRVRGAVRLQVTFPAEDHEHIRVAFDPEDVLVARERLVLSARNVLPGRVIGLDARTKLAEQLRVRVGNEVIRAAVTPEAVASLGLDPGRPVYLYLKATALRRIGGAVPPTRGSLRS
jgi:molybdopterin-binding protein/molybdate transport repressor ModE-like protein